MGFGDWKYHPANAKSNGSQDRKFSGNSGFPGMYRFKLLLLGLARNEEIPLAISIAMRLHIVLARAAGSNRFTYEEISGKCCKPLNCSEELRLSAGCADCLRAVVPSSQYPHEGSGSFGVRAASLF